MASGLQDRELGRNMSNRFSGVRAVNAGPYTVQASDDGYILALGARFDVHFPATLPVGFTCGLRPMADYGGFSVTFGDVLDDENGGDAAPLTPSGTRGTYVEVSKVKTGKFNVISRIGSWS